MEGCRKGEEVLFGVWLARDFGAQTVQTSVNMQSTLPEYNKLAFNNRELETIVLDMQHLKASSCRTEEPR